MEVITILVCQKHGTTFDNDKEVWNQPTSVREASDTFIPTHEYKYEFKYAKCNLCSKKSPESQGDITKTLPFTAGSVC